MKVSGAMEPKYVPLSVQSRAAQLAYCETWPDIADAETAYTTGMSIIERVNTIGIVRPSYSCIAKGQSLKMMSLLVLAACDRHANELLKLKRR